VCVASSSPPDRVASALAIAGFADLFDGRVFSGASAARGKPAPDLFLMAAARLGAPSEACLVIEDSAAGVEAAQRAHMTAFGFIGGSHAVGSEYSERLRAAGASQIFSDMRALPEIIERERAARAARSDG
jgi:beta-phosphoglucomutase-like phosphatase (HAD superfamily)